MCLICCVPLMRMDAASRQCCGLHMVALVHAEPGWIILASLHAMLKVDGQGE